MADNLLDILNYIIRKQIPVVINAGTVKDVDKNECSATIVPDDGSPELTVRLRSVLDDNATGVLLFPKKDSAVIYAAIENNPDNCLVIQYSEIDEFLITGQGDFKVEVDDQGTTKINGGNLGGLVKITPLKTNLEAIKSFATALQTAIVAGFNGVGSGPSASGAAGAAAFNLSMAGQAINYQEMENDKIKQ